MQNFELAKTAVIVFDTTINDCFEPIKDFSKFLAKEGIKAKIFGYVPQKEVPQEMLLWKNFEFITRKDISWYGKPKGEVADLYYSQEPDLLFVFESQENLTLNYLTQLSMAKFKVGCFREDDKNFDFMIKPLEKDCPVAYFIDQIKHYLQILTPITPENE